jgi:hypothetical protein
MAAAVDNGLGSGRQWSRQGEEGRGGEDAEMRSVLSASLHSISTSGEGLCQVYDGMYKFLHTGK